MVQLVDMLGQHHKNSKMYLMQQHLQKLNQLIFDKVFWKINKYLFLILFILELSDDASGFLGRTLGQAINWVRGSNARLDQSTQILPLQTCLTYLTLPCQLIVKDILESNSIPILTLPESKWIISKVIEWLCETNSSIIFFQTSVIFFHCIAYMLNICAIFIFYSIPSHILFFINSKKDISDFFNIFIYFFIFIFSMYSSWDNIPVCRS